MSQGRWDTKISIKRESDSENGKKKKKKRERETEDIPDKKN